MSHIYRVTVEVERFNVDLARECLREVIEQILSQLGYRVIGRWREGVVEGEVTLYYYGGHPYESHIHEYPEGVVFSYTGAGGARNFAIAITERGFEVLGDFWGRSYLERQLRELVRNAYLAYASARAVVQGIAEMNQMAIQQGAYGAVMTVVDSSVNYDRRTGELEIQLVVEG